MYRFGKIQRKILLALMGGVVLGMSPSPSQYFRNFRKIKDEWKKIDRNSFNRALKSLSMEKLIEEKNLPNGSFELILTKEGKKKAKVLDFFGSSISLRKPKRWDRKWRIVLFDIPEKDRQFRDILRSHLKNLEFLKLQHSVFITPHPFEKPILDLISLYSAESFVRVITADKIDNQDKIKNYFFKTKK